MANPTALYDRVWETTTTTGTGTLTLLGAQPGYQSFAVVGNANLCYYAISDPGNNAWEIGVGTWNTGGTLSRTTVLKSSNSNLVVTLGAGTKDVILTWPGALFAMQPSGAGHQPGLTPDTGATANSNFPKVLMDNATWAWKPGELLASFYTANSETTTSTTFVDLTTPDTVSFTLDATTNVIVLYKATEELSAGTPPHSTLDEVAFDGVLDAASGASQGFSAVGFPAAVVLLYKKASLAAGAHTVKIQHKVDGGTGLWAARGMLIFRDL